MSVYRLIDPRDGRTRYVGLAMNPPDRLSRGHLIVKRGQPLLRAWIAELRALGLRPTLEEFAPGSGTEAEYISRLRPDLNVQRGADTDTSEGRSALITLKFSHAEKTELKAAAAAEGKTLSAWIRDTANAYVEKAAGSPYLGRWMTEYPR